MKMFNTLNFLLYCALVLSIPAYAQSGTDAANSNAKLDTDGRDVQIHPSSDTQYQVTIIINKKNPQNLIATCITFHNALNQRFNQGNFSTHDGGTHWTGSDTLPTVAASIFPENPSPWAAFTADTVALLSTATRASGYYISKSYNGGHSYSSVVEGSGAIYINDLRIAADDVPSSRYKNSVYAAWSDGYQGGIGFNRSADTGRTFSNEINLRPGGGYAGQGPSVQTGINGEVYVCWAENDPATGCAFAKSLDGGATFKPYKVAFPYAGIRTDYTSSTFNGTRTVDFPSMVVDKSSGAHRGRIYIAYPSKKTGKAVIYVRYSDDKGNTWSIGKAVSIPNASQSFLPSITVDDATGNVYVDYFAFDNPNVSYSTNTYVAGSKDGLTWRNLKVSDTPHITRALPSGAFEEGTYGKYIGIAAYNNKVYAAWMDARTGFYQVYVSKEIINANSTVNEENTLPVIAAATADKMLVSPNPFSNTLHLLLPTENIKTVELFNQSGKLMKQWRNISSGTLNVTDVLQGIYVLHITDKQNKVYTQKLIKE